VKWQRWRRFWLHHSLDVIGSSILVMFVAVMLMPFWLRGG
jgi:membrane-associated phospholipid phosphatase